MLTELLINQGELEQGDRVVIYAKNSPLWFFSDIATAFSGGITTPIYDTLGLDNIVYCINLVEAKVVFVSADYLHNIVAIIDRIPSVTRIVSFDKIDKEMLKQ